MGRGRPKLYNTPEEQAMAKRAKSKRSYYKNKSTSSGQNNPPDKAETAIGTKPGTKPVGRPKLYKTPEDQAAANRAKSKRSYAKSKAALNVRKAVRYRADTSDTRGIFVGAQRRAPPNIEPTTLPGWMALMSKTSAEFTTLTRGCSRSYVEGLYHRYVLSRRTEHFSDALLSLEALRKTVLRCHNAVLQLAGVGKELRKVQVLDKDIGEVLSSLEDLLCYAIEGYSEATEMYAKGRLMYQTTLTFGS